MLCEVCGVRQGVKKMVTVGGVKRAVVICSECEARSTRRAPTPIPTPPKPVPTAECKACGWTGVDFLETGRVGCEHCYTDLAPILETAIHRCQPTGLHVGKVPAEEDSVRGGEYEHLRNELVRAVKEERYGDAAALKRLLDQLKEGK